MSQFNISKVIIFLLLSLIFYFHTSQLVSQHWSGVLDQDLTIIYNSLLLSSGIDQEYRDHPAFTTFLIHSFFYNIISIFLNVPTDIDQILDASNLEDLLQIYFYISRFVNLIINLCLLFSLSKILKKLNIDKNIQNLLIIIYILSIGYLSSFFLIRSEVLSLLIFSISVNFILSTNKNIISNCLISGFFFLFSMLAKIQILFLLLYIFFLIFKITSSKKIILSNSNFINYYFYFSLFIGILGYSYFQLHIQDFPRFSLNNFIDLIFFSSLFFLFFVTSFFVKKVKENILLLSCFFNGFIIGIILILIFDQLKIINFNEIILLRLTNPIHYMIEFTGTFANQGINLNYISNILGKLFSSYKFNFLELILVLIVACLNFKKNKLIFGLLLIFIINSLIVNYRYVPVYQIYYLFLYIVIIAEAVKGLNLKKGLTISIIALIISTSNSLKYFIYDNNLTNILDRDVGIKKVCDEINFNVKSDTYENVDYMKYWHKKFDDNTLEKICNNYDKS